MKNEARIEEKKKNIYDRARQKRRKENNERRKENHERMKTF